MLECGLSHDRPRSGIWISKAGTRLTAIGKHGAPFGRARALWMYLATRANQSGSTVEVSLSEVAELLGGKSRTNKEHLRRLADCYFHRIDADDPTRSRRQRLLEIINARGSVFTVSLYADFVQSARDAVQCPTEHVAAFIRTNKLAPLDLYLWYQWRAHRGDESPVDAFGPDGPYALLPIADHIDKRRDDFRKRHDLVVDVWPECPFDRDGDQILYCRESADRSKTARASHDRPSSQVTAKQNASQKPARKPAKPARKTGKQVKATRQTPARRQPARQTPEQTGQPRRTYAEAVRELKKRQEEAGITVDSNGRVYFPAHIRKKVRPSRTGRTRSPDSRKPSPASLRVRPAPETRRMPMSQPTASPSTEATASQTTTPERATRKRQPGQQRQSPAASSISQASSSRSIEETRRSLDALRAGLRALTSKR